MLSDWSHSRSPDKKEPEFGNNMGILTSQLNFTSKVPQLLKTAPAVRQTLRSISLLRSFRPKAEPIQVCQGLVQATHCSQLDGCELEWEPV